MSAASRHMMADCETLGLSPGCVVLTVGLAIFSPKDQPGDRHGEVQIRLDVADQLLRGLRIEPDTLAWWRQQDERAREALLRGPGLMLDPALDAIDEAWARHGCEAIWSNGAASDVPWLEALYSAAERKWPWRHSQVRCHRTIVRLAEELRGLELPAPLPDESVKHDAVCDARYQARVCQMSHAAMGRLAPLRTTLDPSYITAIAPLRTTLRPSDILVGVLGPRDPEPQMQNGPQIGAAPREADATESSDRCVVATTDAAAGKLRSVGVTPDEHGLYRLSEVIALAEKGLDVDVHLSYTRNGSPGTVAVH